MSGVWAFELRTISSLVNHVTRYTPNVAGPFEQAARLVVSDLAEANLVFEAALECLNR